MEFSNEDAPAQSRPEEELPRFPRLWIGHLLGLITIVAEIVAVSLHPELAKGELLIPPLYLFLPNFVSLVYWPVCVYEYHVVLARVTSQGYAISPARAAWFHFIPIYDFYWSYKWPREFANFVNSRVATPLLNPARIARHVCSAFVVFLLLDRGLGLIWLCVAASRLSAGLRAALAVQRA
jgi:hypothetical protein